MNLDKNKKAKAMLQIYHIKIFYLNYILSKQNKNKQTNERLAGITPT